MHPETKTVKFTAEFTFKGHAINDAAFKSIATEMLSELHSNATGSDKGYLQFEKVGKVKRVL